MLRAGDLQDILASARRHNPPAGITGMLLYVESSFLQVLEGTRERTDELFERIRADPRHTRTTLLLRESIEARSFGDWTMGTTTATVAELDDALEVNDFFQSREPLHHLGDVKLRKLLLLFRSGSYGRRLS